MLSKDRTKCHIGQWILLENKNQGLQIAWLPGWAGLSFLIGYDISYGPRYIEYYFPFSPFQMRVFKFSYPVPFPLLYTENVWSGKYMFKSWIPGFQEAIQNWQRVLGLGAGYGYWMRLWVVSHWKDNECVSCRFGHFQDSVGRRRYETWLIICNTVGCLWNIHFPLFLIERAYSLLHVHVHQERMVSCPFSRLV